MEAIFSHRLEVRFADCDPLGHANNAKYLTYLEQARLRHWQALWGFGTNLRDEPGVILAHAEIDFRVSARYGDILDVRIGLAAVGRTSFTYEYEIVDASGRLIATARTVQVMYDYAASSPIAIPEGIRAKLTTRANGAPD